MSSYPGCILAQGMDFNWINFSNTIELKRGRDLYPSLQEQEYWYPIQVLPDFSVQMATGVFNLASPFIITTVLGIFEYQVGFTKSCLA